jgi:hypothetical protein
MTSYIITPSSVNFINQINIINMKKIKKIKYRKATRKLYYKNREKKIELNKKYDLAHPEAKRARSQKYNRSEKGKKTAHEKYMRNKLKRIEEEGKK